MKKRVLVLLAPGAEEMETTIVVDVMRRAEIDVVLAGVEGPQPVKCSRGVVIVPDVGLEELRASDGTKFDAVVLPGGAGGAERLGESPVVGRILREFFDAGKLVGAVCAAPLALAAHGVATGRDVTCYPSLRERLAGTHIWHDARVVTSGHLVTSQGPGTTFEFALALVAELVGDDMALRVRKPLLLLGDT